MYRYFGIRANLLAFTLMTVLCCTSNHSCAQENAEDLVYKFTVQEATDRASAKALQYALIEIAGTSYCEFVPECQCFKWGTTETHTWNKLSYILSEFGYQLHGSVLVSDGRELIQPQISTVE